MITAIEAREQTNEIKKKGLAYEISKIEPEIEKAILAGKDSIDVGGPLSAPTMDWLRSLGYEVHIYDRYNESYFTIKW